MRSNPLALQYTLQKRLRLKVGKGKVVLIFLKLCISFSTKTPNDYSRIPLVLSFFWKDRKKLHFYTIRFKIFQYNSWIPASEGMTGQMKISNRYKFHF